MVLATIQTFSEKSLTIQQARSQAKLAKLLFMKQQRKRTIAILMTLNKEISDLLDAYNNYKLKRNRLLNQNFSSSKHLQNTHVKYWNNLQNCKDSILAKHKEKVKLERQLEEINHLMTNAEKLLTKFMNN